MSKPVVGLATCFFCVFTERVSNKTCVSSRTGLQGATEQQNLTRSTYCKRPATHFDLDRTWAEGQILLDIFKVLLL